MKESKSVEKIIIKVGKLVTARVPVSWQDLDAA